MNRRRGSRADLTLREQIPVSRYWWAPRPWSTLKTMGLVERVRLWLLYRSACRMQRKGFVPEADDPAFQPVLDELWAGILRRNIDEWQRRPRLFR